MNTGPASANPQLSLSMLLGLCARCQTTPRQQLRLVRQAESFASWQMLAHTAEEHGLAPLVYHHLSLAKVEIPLTTRRELLGLAQRHRRASQVRLQATAELLGEFRLRGIETFLLKGAALAVQVYPEPGLRPMRDLDLLVRRSELDQACQVLEKLGYQVELSDREYMPRDHHHLPGYHREKEGFLVSVEVHHNLFPPTRHYHPLGFEQLYPCARKIQVHGVEALVPGLEDMLWHLYRHAVGPPLLTIPLRYVSLADIVSLVERYAQELDWERLKAVYPQVFRVLPLLDDLVCWNDTIRAYLDPSLPTPLPGAGEEFRGWPRLERPARGQSLWSYFWDTCAPPEWWLRFFYGVGGGRRGAYLWHRWVRHPFHLAEWGASTLALHARRVFLRSG